MRDIDLRGLEQVSFEERLDFSCGLASVHSRHEHIHKYHLVDHVAASFSHIFLHHLDRALTVWSHVNVNVVIVLQDHLHRHNIVRAIVYHQYCSHAGAVFLLAIILGYKLLLTRWDWTRTSAYKLLLRLLFRFLLDNHFNWLKLPTNPMLFFFFVLQV